METNKNLFQQKAMLWGLFISLALMATTMIFNLTGNDTSKMKGWLDIAISAVGIILCVVAYRNQIDEETPLPYGRVLGLGTLTMLFASIVYAVFFFFFMQFIDPEFIDKTIAASEQILLDRGMDPDMVEQAMKQQSFMYSPAVMSVMSIFGLVFRGFLISLIVAIFFKKKAKSGFDGAMSEIDDED